MRFSVGNSLLILVLICAGSCLVLGQTSTAPQTDPCLEADLDLRKDNEFPSCLKCVQTKYGNDTQTCVFFEASTAAPGLTCQKHRGDTAFNLAATEADCSTFYGKENTTTTTPAPPPPTTPTTPAPITTTVPPNGTTTTTTTTPTTTPTTKATTPAPPTTTSTAAPANGTTTTAPPTTTSKGTTPAPAPAPGGGFSFATFLGGIVFTLAVSSLAYVVFRFYKARTERNYHTLNTNLI